MKSKILMHRLPVAITKVPSCFSQDIKAIVPREQAIPPTFLARHLRIGHKALLGKARGANTKGLTLEHLGGYRLTVPPLEMCETWVAVEQQVAMLRAAANRSLAEGTSLFGSVEQWVFGREQG